MGKSLVIVESPAKARTINKYLGRDFVVKSSVGHIRDLPVSGSGKKVDPKARAKAAAKTRKMPAAKREKHKKEQAKRSLFARMGINPVRSNSGATNRQNSSGPAERYRANGGGGGHQ